MSRKERKMGADDASTRKTLRSALEAYVTAELEVITGPFWSDPGSCPVFARCIGQLRDAAIRADGQSLPVRPYIDIQEGIARYHRVMAGTVVHTCGFF